MLSETSDFQPHPSIAHLNPQQQQAVQCVDSPLLVLAGAGSGKTSVITDKIVYLINHCFIPESQIFAVTFTNKAAREMKERVSKKIKNAQESASIVGEASKRGRRKVNVSTFHQLGLKIIRSQLEALELKNGFSILDEQDSLAVIKEVTNTKTSKDDDFIAIVRRQIGYFKNDLLTPDDALAQAQTEKEANIARIFAEYQQYLNACNVVDFDDLIYLPTLLIKQDEDVRLKWQTRCGYLLVDEYQDTNIMQYELVKLLVGDSQRLTVVGDDDQSIYTWRGANPENLSQLSKDFPSLEVIKLEQNYRSTGRILRAANAVIANNSHMFDKKLWSDGDFGEPIRSIQCSDEHDEVEFIAYDLCAEQLKSNNPFSDYAVLYRSNHQARLIELKLRELQIPYKVSGGMSFFSRTEIKDVLAYLRLLTNPSDDMAFARIINTPRREIGAATLEKLARYCQDIDTPFFHACDHLALSERLSKKACKNLHNFHNWLTRKQHFAQDSPLEAINELLDDINYEAWLIQQSGDVDSARRKMENVHQLVDMIRRQFELSNPSEEDLEQGVEAQPDKTLEEIISNLLLQDLLKSQQDEKEENAVSLMTLHASKGLEFTHVYLVGNEENILPHKNSIETNSIEEERRLFYVGITRAKQTLVLTRARKRKSYGDTIVNLASRFLEEIPQDDVIQRGEISLEEGKTQEQKIQENFDALLDLFD